MKKFLKKMVGAARNRSFGGLCGFAGSFTYRRTQFCSHGIDDPTILEGDFVFLNLLSYGLRVPMTDYRIAQ